MRLCGTHIAGFSENSYNCYNSDNNQIGIIVKFLLLLPLIFLTACSDNGLSTIDVDISQAQEYVIIETESYPTPPDKLGKRIFIYAPKANSFEQRGHTLVKAAHELVNSKGLYEVIIKLLALPSIEPKYVQAGRAQYNPYKKNTWGEKEDYVWEVEASSLKIVDGQLDKNGKLYPLDYMPASKYLEQ